MAIIRIVVGYALSVIIATVLGALVHTQVNLAGIAAAGAPTPLDLRLETSLGDLAGLAPVFGPVVAIAFAVGFAVAAVLRLLLRPLAGVAFPLAGAAAMATALVAMKIAYAGVTPLGSARTAVGFGLLCLVGAVGGLVFGAFAARRRV